MSKEAEIAALKYLGSERERLLADLASLGEDLRPAVRRARDAGATIAECAKAAGVSPQALHKLLGQIPTRNTNG